MTRSPSRSLFISSPTRSSPPKTLQNDNESEDDLPATKSDRFKALVERKRQERLAREAEEEAKKAERRAAQEKLASELDSGNEIEESITDDEGGRKLTQQARPARKASKKAIEEMNRETQRMARNMQLAHEAKTKKKITTASLFERFNFKPVGSVKQPEPKTTSSSRPSTPQSDAEMKNAETPPSSPPSDGKSKSDEQAQVNLQADDEEELPTLDVIMSSAPVQLDKGKGKAFEIVEPAKPKRQVRVRFPVTAVNTVSLDSDEDLEVTRTSKDKLSAVFDSIPSKKAKDSHSVQALRALAGVRPQERKPVRKSNKLGISPQELQAQLQQRVRLQAKMERERRLEMLKAQGVVVQTAEERERQMQEVEDIVAKAREEAQAIMQIEREEAKKERRENGEADPLAWDDSDDEEYQDPGEEADVEASDVELSGSEDEEGDDDEEDADEEGAPNPMFEQEADEDEAEEEKDEPMNDEDDDDDDDMLIQRLSRKRKLNTVLLSDDEAEAEAETGVQATPRPKMTPSARKDYSPAVPNSVLRSNKKSFIPGVPVEGPAGLGLTQMFAGTMDDSQMSPQAGPTQSMMPDFDAFPDSNFSATADEPAGDVVMDSQNESHPVELHFTQTQFRNLDSLINNQDPATQMSGFEPTQDGGIQQRTPLKERFMEVPHSTIETLPGTQGDATVQDSPLIRRGRLHRRMETLEEESAEPTSSEKVNTAFNTLQKGARKEQKKKLMEEFNKKKSKAREMVQEQAEESEDEYAGIGGADGEDSDDESVASVKEMIDDAAGNDADERKLAAFYA